MHLKRDDSHHHGPPVIPVTFVLEDPEGLTGTAQREWHVMGGEHESLLEVAIDNGINIEHACGGVCACSTCHVYLEQGATQVNEASEDEEDRVEEAPGIKRTSRLSCSSSRLTLSGRSALSITPLTNLRYTGISASASSMMNTRLTYSFTPPRLSRFQRSNGALAGM